MKLDLHGVSRHGVRPLVLGPIMVSGYLVRAKDATMSAKDADCARRRSHLRAASLSYDGTAAHLHSFSGTASGKDDAA